LPIHRDRSNVSPHGLSRRRDDPGTRFAKDEGRIEADAGRREMNQAIMERSARQEELLRAVDAGLDEARVLVVEDDEEMRSFLEESLREEGYLVTTASNTLSAIVTLMGGRPDVLVVDWKMPDLDGFALLSAVRRCFTGVPVIFVTAFARPEIETRALEEGAFGFLPKPFRLSVLVAEIERALRKRPVPQGPGGGGAPSRPGNPVHSAGPAPGE
jgi:CheY-like chemotaxis protein